MTDSRPQSVGFLYRLGRWCAAHPWPVIGLWVLLLVGATLGHRIAGSSYVDDFQLPSAASQPGADLLAAHQPTAGGQSGQIVFSVPAGSLQDDRAAIESSMNTVRALPHVLSAADPLGAVSTDGRIASAGVQFQAQPVSYGADYLRQVDAAVQPARTAGVEVDYGGALGQAAKPKANDSLSEVIGVLVALAVLLLGFGSVFATGIPLLAAIGGVGTGLGVLGIVASGVTFATVSPTLAIMMGLGVGIDYALFLTTRHRQQVSEGVSPVESAARTLATSGRAVLVAALTVVIALLGLYASGIGFVGKLGLAASITVAIAALCSITLVPALLGLAGRRIDRLRVRRPVAESSGDDDLWHRHARRVARHRWWFLIGGIVALVVLAVPALSMTLGHVGNGDDPTSWTDRQAYDRIAEGFGPGANGPFTVVADVASVPMAERPGIGTALHDTLAGTTGVASVGEVRPSADGALLIASVVPSTGPSSEQTQTLLQTLRDTTLPQFGAQHDGVVPEVTGAAAYQIDFETIVSARLPVIIAVVVVLAFLLLLMAFRAPVLALKAALLNLLSIGASYGVIVAVFQWGWGASLLGLDHGVPIESYVPMMMFAIVFGLSMDYEVFLLSRMRESWLATDDNTRSVAQGLSATARVITCAALIMASVFLAFLLSGSIVIKMLALGLGVSVLVDATLIRLVVVPAAMFLLGRVNWWCPRWLDRVLPRLEAEVPAGVAAREADTVRP